MHPFDKLLEFDECSELAITRRNTVDTCLPSPFRPDLCLRRFVGSIQRIQKLIDRRMRRVG